VKFPLLLSHLSEIGMWPPILVILLTIRIYEHSFIRSRFVSYGRTGLSGVRNRRLAGLRARLECVPKCILSNQLNVQIHSRMFDTHSDSLITCIYFAFRTLSML
jgi:hypothetical protein